MYQEEIKIPEDRIAVLIGKKGSEKKLLEKKTNTTIEISSGGDVVIKGEDNFKVFLTKNIVQAIARGVNPDIAIKLLNENCYLEIINIQDFIGKSKKKQLRLKSRVIGTKGKARHNIEKPSCQIDGNICDSCGICVNLLNCPALSKGYDSYAINEILCVGCGVCAQVCPKGAIK